MRLSKLMASIGSVLIAALSLAAGEPAGDRAAAGSGTGAPVTAPPAAGTGPDHHVEVGQSDLTGLDRLLPVGKSATDVVLPSLDEEGRLASVTQLHKVSRIDTENFAIEGGTLSSFDAGAIDATTGRAVVTVIAIESGVYNQPSKTLTSQRPVRLTKPGVEMTGASLVYHADGGYAVMKGHVELILTGVAAPTKAETPAPPPSVPAPPIPVEPVPK